jgi:hypothetical protein
MDGEEPVASCIDSPEKEVRASCLGQDDRKRQINHSQSGNLSAFTGGEFLVFTAPERKLYGQAEWHTHRLTMIADVRDFQ